MSFVKTGLVKKIANVEIKEEPPKKEDKDGVREAGQSEPDKNSVSDTSK